MTIKNIELIIYGYDFYPSYSNNLDNHKKSGLALYNTFQIYGFQKRGFRPSFIRSHYGIKENLFTENIDDIKIFNMPVRFSQYFEPNGKFNYKLPNRFYHHNISLDNPIYKTLYDNLRTIIATYNTKTILINTHNFIPTVVACLVKRESNNLDIKIFATIHDVNTNLIQFIKDNQKYVRKFIAISKSNRNVLENIGITPSKIALISNGINIKLIKKNLQYCKKENIWDRLCEQNLIKKNCTLIALPSRRVPHKGHYIAFKALEYLLNSYSIDIQLLVTGNGMGQNWYLKELKQTVIKMGIEKNVIFLGKIASAEMPAIYDNSDLIITPSIEKEGFCYANIECMIIGHAPVITSNFGGVLDYIDHLETGYLFSAGNHIELANAIKILINNNSLRRRIVSKAKKRAIGFGINHMIDQYMALFKG